MEQVATFERRFGGHGMNFIRCAKLFFFSDEMSVVFFLLYGT
jgi:hypothetical protein